MFRTINPVYLRHLVRICALAAWAPIPRPLLSISLSRDVASSTAWNISSSAFLHPLQARSASVPKASMRWLLARLAVSRSDWLRR